MQSSTAGSLHSNYLIIEPTHMQRIETCNKMTLWKETSKLLLYISVGSIFRKLKSSLECLKCVSMHVFIKPMTYLLPFLLSIVILSLFQQRWQYQLYFQVLQISGMLIWINLLNTFLDMLHIDFENLTGYHSFYCILKQITTINMNNFTYFHNTCVTSAWSCAL